LHEVGIDELLNIMVGWLVGRSVGRSVGWLVGWLVLVVGGEKLYNKADEKTNECKRRDFLEGS
jgi:hypothetical protein